MYNGVNPDGTKRNRLDQLARVVYHKQWPTPTATERSGVNPNCPEKIQGLTHAVKSWPTPCTRDYKGANAKDGLTRNDGKSRMDQLPNAVAHGDKPEPSGALNPTWVEWLMGWPIGWTSMEAITALDWRDWETDPADELPPEDWRTPMSCDHKNMSCSKQVYLQDQIKDRKAGTGSIPRVATCIKHRVGRLKAIGNGQVPQVAALAWEILTKEL